MSLSIALLTVSNSRTTENDTTGDYLAQMLTADGHPVIHRAIEHNHVWNLRKTLCQWISDDAVQVIITNGGTGYTHDKSTITAIRPLLDQTIHGFGELFRHLSYLDIGSAALQSDALGGIANNTLIFCLPGSLGACKLAWEGILHNQLDSSAKPCNFTTYFNQ